MHNKIHQFGALLSIWALKVSYFHNKLVMKYEILLNTQNSSLTKR